MSRRVPPAPKRLFLVAVLCVMGVLAVACPSSAPSPTPQTTTAPPPGDGEPIAILTLVENEVFLEEPSAQRLPGLALLQTGRQVRPFQLLPSGAILRLAANAGATIVCFNNRFFRATGGTTVRVTNEWCQAGTPLPSRSVSRVKPEAGRIRVVSGSLILEEEVREKEGDYGRIPIVLSPRNTHLLGLPSEIRWVEVSDAVEYVLSMTGPARFDDIVLDTEELSCTEDAIAEYRLCSLPWPADQWALEEGRAYFLTIGARLGIASQPRPSEDSRLDVLDAAKAGDVQAEVEAIQALDLDAVTQDLLLAGLYAEHDVYGEAIAAYERIMEAYPSAVLYVTLGDTYRKTALYRWAFDAYQKALDLLTRGEDDPAVRAAAEFGIGQVYHNYAENYVEAEEHYTEAVRLYEHLGSAEELKAAQQGLEEAQRRSP